ncbi:hypothetical protein HKX48_006840 [Thoreauomyces humboldtii]|nr:hypothetical protein HKX48_006840 [Thoreauomyces humboldtii]
MAEMSRAINKLASFKQSVKASLGASLGDDEDTTGTMGRIVDRRTDFVNRPSTADHRFAAQSTSKALMESASWTTRRGPTPRRDPRTSRPILIRLLTGKMGRRLMAQSSFVALAP